MRIFGTAAVAIGSAALIASSATSVAAQDASSDKPKEAAKDKPKEKSGKDKDKGKKEKKEKVVPTSDDNIKGVSPYEKQIAEGKKYAAEANWPLSANAFEKAIAMNPEEARGYLLLAQAKREGDVLEIVEKGRAKKASEAIESKLIFVRAELLERKAALTPITTGDLGEMLRSVWDQSIQAWSTYAAFVTTHTRAPDYKATAEERKSKIADREKREQQFAPVRAKRDNK
jgi:hypothetical protein